VLYYVLLKGIFGARLPDQTTILDVGAYRRAELFLMWVKVLTFTSTLLVSAQQDNKTKM
jgi:hypothetical protein